MDGSTRAFKPEAVRRPVVHHPIATVSPRPNDGSQPREHREHENEENAGDERGQRNTDEGYGHQNVGEHAAALERRVDPQWNADHQREEGSGKRQLERGRQALDDHGRNRPLLAQALPEVSLRRAPEEVRVLQVEGLIEAKEMSDTFALLGGGVLPEHEHDGIADEAKQREGDEPHDEHDQHGLKDSAGDEGNHGMPAARKKSRQSGGSEPVGYHRGLHGLIASMQTLGSPWPSAQSKRWFSCCGLWSTLSWQRTTSIDSKRQGGTEAARAEGRDGQTAK